MRNAHVLRTPFTVYASLRRTADRLGVVRFISVRPLSAGEIAHTMTCAHALKAAYRLRTSPLGCATCLIRNVAWLRFMSQIGECHTTLMTLLDDQALFQCPSIISCFFFLKTAPFIKNCDQFLFVLYRDFVTCICICLNQYLCHFHFVIYIVMRKYLCMYHLFLINNLRLFYLSFFFSKKCLNFDYSDLENYVEGKFSYLLRFIFIFFCIMIVILERKVYFISNVSQHQSEFYFITMRNSKIWSYTNNLRR